MILKIKWGDMESLLKKQFTTEQEMNSPIFYFESEEEIFVYQAIKGGYILLCASVLKESSDSLKSFKMEFLSKATELLERPNDKVSLVIKQVD